MTLCSPPRTPLCAFEMKYGSCSTAKKCRVYHVLGTVPTVDLIDWTDFGSLIGQKRTPELCQQLKEKIFIYLYILFFSLLDQNNARSSSAFLFSSKSPNVIGLTSLVFLSFWECCNARTLRNCLQERRRCSNYEFSYVIKKIVFSPPPSTFRLIRWRCCAVFVTFSFS